MTDNIIKAFDGFEEPKENWSKLPHQLIAALPQITSLSEMKVILYILRHTWGFHDSEKRITLDEFQNGRKKADGTRIDNGVGMSRPSIVSGLKSAEEHGFILTRTDASDKGRVKKFYSLNDKEGLKSFTPAVQELNPTGKTDEPRSEKETSDRNFRNNIPLADAKEVSEDVVMDYIKEHQPIEGKKLVVQFGIAAKRYYDHLERQQKIIPTKQGYTLPDYTGPAERDDTVERLAAAEKGTEALEREYYQAVLEVFGVGDAQNRNYQRLLGWIEGGRGEWKEYRLSASITPDELRAWAKAYKSKNPTLTIVKEPEKVNGSISAWMETRSAEQTDKAQQQSSVNFTLLNMGVDHDDIAA